MSSRFGDIFRNNTLKQGLIPVTVPEPVAHTILTAVEDDAATEIVIDVVHRRVRGPVDRTRRALRARRLLQHRLVEGLDDIGITLQRGRRDRELRRRTPGLAPEGAHLLAPSSLCESADRGAAHPILVPHAWTTAPARYAPRPAPPGVV